MITIGLTRKSKSQLKSPYYEILYQAKNFVTLIKFSLAYYALGRIFMVLFISPFYHYIFLSVLAPDKLDRQKHDIIMDAGYEPVISTE